MTKPSSNPKRRACAVCGEGERMTLVMQQRYEVPTRGGVHSGYDVVVCDRCGFGFAQTPPCQEYLDFYYSELAKKSEMLDQSVNFEETNDTVLRNQNSLRNITSLMRPGNRVLEIGCYTGYLLAQIKHDIPNVMCMGLETSAFAASIAKTRYDIEVCIGSIFDDNDLGTFDIVIVLHVLEHIVDLRRFLSRLREFLKIDGRLHIEVPDATNFTVESGDNSFRLARREPYIEFNFEHINYFTPRSLQNLMELSGYETLSVDSQVSTFPVVASTWTMRQTLPFAEETLDALRVYVQECIKTTVSADSVLRKLSEAKREIIVWGAGPHTQRLIGSQELDISCVRFFVDSNPDFLDATLAGRPVFAPIEVRSHGDVPILVSSFRFEREIADQIRDAGYTNDVILLYDESPVRPA
jgi:SAM-dependent methyltransferase